MAALSASGLFLTQSWSQVKTEKAEMNSATHSHTHTNRLAREKSPYLLQHQHNPVDWFAWGDEAFEKARGKTNRSSSASVTRPATGAM